jgi:hypothetical protein
MSPTKLVKANCNVMCHPGPVEVHIELSLCVHCACMLAVCSKREKVSTEFVVRKSPYLSITILDTGVKSNVTTLPQQHYVIQ